MCLQRHVAEFVEADQRVRVGAGRMGDGLRGTGKVSTENLTGVHERKRLCTQKRRDIA